MIMTVSTTPARAIAKGKWGDVCKVLDIPESSVNDEVIGATATIKLTEEQAVKIGLYE